MDAQLETKPNSHPTGSSATQLVVILYRKENYMSDVEGLWVIQYF